jgi:uncharacterized protein YidB (DUF937 family)
MGLLDVMNGMANGPRGTPQPATPGSGGMSKTTIALLAFLAYKAYKSRGSQPAHTQPPAPSRDPNDDRDDRYRAQPRAGLGDILRNILLGGASVPAPLLSRGVSNTVRDLENSGHGDVARSWVDRGTNRTITPRQLEAALGEDAIRDLKNQTGMERDELLETLSEHLPRVIDHLTPQGRLPTDAEAARMA